MRDRTRCQLLLLITVLALVLPARAQTPAGTVVEYQDTTDFPNAPGGLYFYSSDATEQGAVDIGLAGAFFRTGRTFAAGGATPVCRFYGSVTPGPNSHFFTADAGECAALKAAQIVPTPVNVPQWNFEGAGFRTSVPVSAAFAASGSAPLAMTTCPGETMPVLRAYNNAFSASGAKNPWDSNHRFVRAQADIDAVVARGWRDEGMVFCAPISPTSRVFAETAALAGRCVHPRSDAAHNDRPGTLTAEKAWVRSYIDENYLWYREVPDLVAGDYPDAVDYFNVLKTPAKTPGGRDRDRFHFVFDTAALEALNNDVGLGYGMDIWALSETPPRRYVVVYTYPGTPASNALIDRGGEILAVDGIDAIAGSDIATLNNGLFPVHAGESHTFRIRDRGAAAARTVTLTSAIVAFPHLNIARTLTTQDGKVGYIMFEGFGYPTEGALIDAVNQFKAAHINDLILDFRYNTGGLIFVASELAYMIAGPATAGKDFARLTFNDKRSGENGRVSFRGQTSGLPGTGTTANVPLPNLAFKRMFVLTGSNTESASEAVINALDGIGIQTIRIGTTTYGKPYGMEPQDNCGLTYFSVDFKGVNNAGFGEYDDGMNPTCAVADDFDHALGDPDEALLAGALAYRATGMCPAASVMAPAAGKRDPAGSRLLRHPLRENMFLNYPGLRRRS